MKALGPVAFELEPLVLLELAACLAEEEQEESERFDGFAFDLATIQNLPEVSHV